MILHSRKLILPNKKSGGGGFQNNTYIAVYIDNAYGKWGWSAGNSNYNNRNRVYICFSEDLINWERYNLLPSDTWTTSNIYTPYIRYFDNHIILGWDSYKGATSSDTSRICRVYYFTKEDIVNGGNIDTLPYFNNKSCPIVVNGNLICRNVTGQSGATSASIQYSYIPAGMPISENNFITVSGNNGSIATSIRSFAYQDGVYAFSGITGSAPATPKSGKATTINGSDMQAQVLKIGDASGPSDTISAVNGMFFVTGSSGQIWSGSNPTSLSRTYMDWYSSISGAVLYGNGYYFTYGLGSSSSRVADGFYSTTGTSWSGIGKDASWGQSSYSDTTIFDGEKFVTFVGLERQITLFTRRIPTDTKTILWRPTMEMASTYGGSGNASGTIIYVPKGANYVEGHCNF